MSRRFRLWSSLGGTLCATVMLISCGGESVDGDGPPPAGAIRVSVRMPLATAMDARGGTLFSIASADGTIQATAGISKTWNSYCASHPLQVHFFLGSSARFPLTTERHAKPDADLKTAYGFSTADKLIVVDRANGKQFRDESDPAANAQPMWQEIPAEQQVNCPQFTLNGWVYPQISNVVRACHDVPEEGVVCDEMAIREGTFTYAFADAAGSVVTVTNWGDVLIHRPKEGWCRAADDGAGFACPPDGAPVAQPPEEPTGIQFYSSIKYRGETLMGRYPGGLIYRFDGTRLEPYHDTPPLPANGITEKAEAQSMANYCGDLYVGFWPRGALWIRHLQGGAWERLGRVFTHPREPEPAIPYLGSEPEGTPWAFLGQRITALVPLHERLYMTTSNLSAWSADTLPPEYLTQDQIDEYGAVHSLYRPGCITAQLDEDGAGRMHFDFGPTHISIRQGTRLLAEIPNPGYMPSPGDRVLGWSPVFGEGLAEVLSDLPW